MVVEQQTKQLQLLQKQMLHKQEEDIVEKDEVSTQIDHKSSPDRDSIAVSDEDSSGIVDLSLNKKDKSEKQQQQRRESNPQLEIIPIRGTRRGNEIEV